MDLRKLSYFVAVARASSFTRAAAMLHVSQPALGLQVKELERGLGTTLFVRHGRGVQLTEAGRTLFREAEQILTAFERAQRALENYRTPERRDVLFGATPASPTQALLPGLILAGAKQSPALRVSVRQGFSDELRSMVEAGVLDAALCSDPVASDRAVAIHLFTERLFVVGAAGALPPADEGLAFAALARLPLVLDRRSRILRAEIERLARAEGIQMPEPLEVEPRELKRELILRHGCFAVLPCETFSEEIAAGVMACAPIADPPILRRQALLIRHALPAYVSDFIVEALKSDVARLARDSFPEWRLDEPA
jgi:LysR family nitrogen assimilation transcriptional regulator